MDDAPSVDGRSAGALTLIPSTTLDECTYPKGCCKMETNISTADAAAMGATPGRVTVHIWSRVRSVRD